METSYEGEGVDEEPDFIPVHLEEDLFLKGYFDIGSVNFRAFEELRREVDRSFKRDLNLENAMDSFVALGLEGFMTFQCDDEDVKKYRPRVVYALSALAKLAAIDVSYASVFKPEATRRVYDTYVGFVKSLCFCAVSGGFDDPGKEPASGRCSMKLLASSLAGIIRNVSEIRKVNVGAGLEYLLRLTGEMTDPSSAFSARGIRAIHDVPLKKE